MDPMQRLNEALRIEGDEGLSGLMIGLLAGTFMTIAFQFWEFMSALGGTIMAPFQAFGEALAQLVRGSIGAPVIMLEASAQTGVESVTEGLFSTFGIFAYPVTMVAVMAGIFVFARAWSAIDLSPWNFLRSLRR